MGLVVCLRAGAAFAGGLVGFATRDATLDRGGRGIVASESRVWCDVVDYVRSFMIVFAIGSKWVTRLRRGG